MTRKGGDTCLARGTKKSRRPDSIVYILKPKTYAASVGMEDASEKISIKLNPTSLHVNSGFLKVGIVTVYEGL